MNDIDLTPAAGLPNKDLSDIGTLGIAPADLWTPIGDGSSNAFSGRFNGNGFTIRGMTINSGATYLGLFGYTKGAVIYNVNMQDARVKGAQNLGSLVGDCEFSTISLCSATGCSLQSTVLSYIGGLVAINGDGSAITRCHATACTIISTNTNSLAGGLASNNYGTLASCYAAGCTGTNSKFGGLVGNNNSIIYGCYATYAQVTGTGGTYGSLVGSNYTGAIAIASSYAINAAGSTLGLVGENKAEITACVSPFENASSNGASTPGSNGEDGGGGFYWEIKYGNGNFNGGYTPLTDDALLGPLGNGSNAAFTNGGDLKNVYSILVNNTGQDLGVGIDMGGGDDSGTPVGVLKTIPPGALYTVKRTWKALDIWGGEKTTPINYNVILPLIDWEYNGPVN